jgi:MFS family permease
MSPGPLAKEKLRWITLVFFFLSGIITATWASRIPDVQSKLGLNDAEWGVVLFALPLGLVSGLPISSWIVAKYSAQKIMVWTSVLFAINLFLLPLSYTKWQLAIILFLFGLLRNATNFSINTYSLEVQKLYNRPIIATFHGIWSLACLLAAGIGIIMVAAGVIPLWHFLVVALITITGCLFYRNTGYTNSSQAAEKRPVFIKPTRYLFLLGLVALCSMICEATMFDWGVNYFRQVIQAKKEWSVVGYALFITAMVTGRLVGDKLIAHYGAITMLMLNGGLMAAGFVIAISFPYFLPACLGFLLIGLGDSILIPMLYMLAGQTKVMAPGYAIASVTMVGYVGFLTGPLIIGSISERVGMQWAFGLMAILSTAIIGITLMVKKHIPGSS